MTNRIPAPLALWLVAAATVIAALAAFRSAPGDPPVARAEVPRAAPPPANPARERGRLRLDAALLRDRDPFRLERAPTAQRFGAPPRIDIPPQPMAMPQPPPPPAPPPPPPLSLSGIVGGPPWQAVIEHVPGAAHGVLVAAGEEEGGVRVLWIRGDSVGVVHDGKMQVLTLKQPFQ